MAINLKQIATPDYQRLCVAVFLFFAGLHFLTPVVPVYLQSLGFKGTPLGMLLGTFLVSSLLLRPWVGRESDLGRPKYLMLTGIFLGSAAAFWYWLLSPWPWTLWITRAVHGISFALFYTAATGYLVRTVPAEFKAEAISYYSNAVKFAMAFAPGLALWVMHQYGMNAAFIATGIITLLAVVVILPLKPAAVVASAIETTTGNSPAPAPEPETPTPPKTVMGLLPKALPLSVIMASQSAVFGALIPFIPLMATERHYEHSGWFYALYALSLVATRFVSGSVSDTHGRTTVLLPSMAMVSVSIFLLAWAPNDWAFLAITVLYGLAAGAVQPSIMALITEQVDEAQQSTAMATFSVFADVGIALGNVVMASVGYYLNYGWGLVAIGIITLIGLAGMAVQTVKTEPHLPAGRMLRVPAVQFRRWYRGF